MTSELSFIHTFVPAEYPSKARTLLMLHGSGGNENDLLSLGHALNASANLLSPRGKVLENGMPRFFRRFAEGVFDVEDLQIRTQELADFIRDAADRYGFDATHVTAVGYSNGANIAASLLLLRPESIESAILLRAVLPFEPKIHPKLHGKTVLILGGTEDHMMPRAGTERLAQVLEDAGASVTVSWQPAGHGLTDADISSAKSFLL